MIAITGAVGAAAVALGTVVAIAPETPPAPATAVAQPAAPVIDRAAVIRTAQARLADLEAGADAAGAAAQRADEAVLQHDTAANRAAAAVAQDRLVALAEQQTPELTRLAASLTAAGVDPTAASTASDGTTATTAALVGRTKALRAVSYAEKQIGDPYSFAGAGPGRWDCSGLTMKSYSAVKVGIGGHSATAQWRTARSEHRLHAYKHRKRGDLIFYGAPGAVYHVAIYAGHNRMIEAPYPGKRVREVAVRSAGRLSVVARPA
ncbi:C40 family peptidase [uncultured Amnibacterium sp.]|uniref:C40 family peptidase n=1 Tax=uncultured Amnibacterium sp. TaxID=1631851 RepID=UPI0035CA8E6D